MILATASSTPPAHWRRAFGVSMSSPLRNRRYVHHSYVTFGTFATITSLSPLWTTSNNLTRGECEARAHLTCRSPLVKFVFELVTIGTFATFTELLLHFRNVWGVFMFCMFPLPPHVTFAVTLTCNPTFSTPPAHWRQAFGVSMPSLSELSSLLPHFYFTFRTFGLCSLFHFSFATSRCFCFHTDL